MHCGEINLAFVPQGPVNAASEVLAVGSTASNEQGKGAECLTPEAPARWSTSLIRGAQRGFAHGATRGDFDGASDQHGAAEVSGHGISILLPGGNSLLLSTMQQNNEDGGVE